MPDNRVDITIQAQDRSRAAFQQAQQNIQRTSQAVQVAQERSRAASQQAQQDFQRTNRAVKETSTAVGGLNDQFRRGGASAREYAGAIGNIHVQLIALNAANQLVQRSIRATIVAQSREAVQLERLNVGLQSLSSSYAEAAAQRERLIEASRLPGLNLEQALRSSLQLQAIGETGERATRIITEFGNALALSGQPASELRAVISGLRQISGEGKVLQEDIGIITSRVAALGRGLRETFGGTRAEDIRRFYDALGVRGSEQGPRFISDVLKILSELPRAGDTAANSLENLMDTFDRAQATIGQNFLPVIRELTAGLEGLAKQVEDDPDLARTIAQWETFLGTLGSVTFAVAGLGAALKILGPGALLALKSPLGLAAIAAGALAGGLLTLKIRAEEATPAQKNLERTTTELAKSYKSLAEAQQDVTDAQNKLNEATEGNVGVAAATAELAKAQNELREAGEMRIDTLENRAKALVESLATEQEEVKALQQEYKGLTEQIGELTEQSTFFARFWERFTAGLAFGQNQGILTPDLIENVTGQSEVSGPTARLRRAEREQAAVDRELNVIVPAARALGESELNRINTQIRELENAQREQRGVAGVRNAVTGASSVLRNVEGGRELPFATPSGLDDDEADRFDRSVKDLTDGLEKHHQAMERITQRVSTALPQHVQRNFLGQRDPRARQSVPITVPGVNIAQGDPGILGSGRGAAQASVAATDRQRFLADLEGRLADANNQISQSGLDTLNIYRNEAVRIFDQIGEARTFSELNTIEEVLGYNARLYGDLQGYAESHAALLTRLDAQREGLAEDTNQRIAEAQRRQNERTARELEQSRQRGGQRDEQDRDRARQAARQLGVEGANRRIAQAHRDLLRLQDQQDDAFSSRRLERIQHETAQALARYQEFYKSLSSANYRAFVDIGALSAEEHRTQLQSTGRAIQNLERLYGDLGVSIDEALRAERLERFRDGLRDIIDDLGRTTLDYLFDSLAGGTDRASEALADYAYRVGEAQQSVSLLVGDVTRLNRLQEDAALREDRLGEDRDRRIQQLRRQQQALAARAPTGDQRALQRNIQQRQDIAFRIRELREDFGVRIARAQEDFVRRRDRLVEDATARRDNRRDVDDGLLDRLGSVLASHLSSALSSAIAGAIAGALTGALSSQFASLIDAIKRLFGGGDGDTDTGTGGGTGTGDADVDGTIKTLTVDPELATPSVDVAGVIKSAMQAAADAYTIPSVDVTGQITSAKLSEGATLPPVALTGTITASLVKNFTEPVPITGVINATLNAPQSIDLSQVPVTLPQAAVEVTTPESVDLSQVPVIGVPAQSVKVNTPESVDLSAVPVTGIPAQAVEVTTPESVDLSNVPVVSIPTQKVMVDTPSSVDLSQVPVVSIPTQRVKVDTPSSVDLSNVPVTNISAQSIKVTAPQSVDLSGVPITLPQAALEIATPEKFDLSAVPVTLPRAALEIYTPTGFDLSGVPVTLPPATLDVGLNLPDPELLPPIDLGGLRLTNIPTVNIPFTLAPETPGTTEGTTEGTGGAADTTPPPGNTIADVVANEGRRGKVFGSGNPTVQTDITSEELTNSIREGNQQAAERSGLHNLPRALAEGFQRIAGAIISSGAIGVGTGGGAGDSLDTGQLARELGQDLDGSFRSDVIPTLLGNQPGTVQPGDRDPDDDTAQAPAAPRSTAAAFSAIADLLSLDALANVAQESTLASVASTLDSIRIATQRTADSPIVDRLIEAGIGVPQTLEERTNSALPDFLTQQGLGLFADQDRLNSFLADMGPTPDLTAGIGGEGNPLFAKVEFPDVQKVEVVSGKVDANVTNEVNVKQVGTVQVTQAGEWVIRLASGATIPVYVQGGHVTADIAGGLEGLAIQLADEEVGLRAVGAI